MSALQPPSNQILPAIAKEDLGNLFAVLTAKQDSETQLYDRQITVSLKSIFALARRMEDRFSMIQELKSVNDATISFEGNLSRDFKTIQDLEYYEWHYSKVTHALLLRWSLLFVIPGFEKPVQHHVTIRISRAMRAQDFFRAAMSFDRDDDDYINLTGACCVCRVSFASQSLASDVFREVEQWVEAHPTPQYSYGWLKWLRRRSHHVRKIVKFLFPASATLVLGMWYWSATAQTDLIAPATASFVRNSVAFLIFFSLMIGVASAIGTAMGLSIERVLDSTGEDHHCFALTEGDNNRQLELIAKSKKKLRVFFWQGVVAVGWNIVAALVIWCFSKKI